MYRVTTLPNGLRIATHHMPHVESVSVGVWVGVGGRYEPSRLSGISHFIEHLLFKGTRHRTAKQISESVESVGGYLNAFTSEETTCYYAKAAHDYFPRLFDVLSDMYLHPLFAAEDIEKERGVIQEEIKMYHDQPAQHVHELLGQTMWPNQPLGRSLTGSVETVAALTKSDFLDYRRQKYLAANTVIAVAGRCWHEDVAEAVENHLGTMKNSARLPKFAPVTSSRRALRICLHTKETEQTHLAMGVHGYSRHDARRYALRLLSIILGENMSSRLFQVVRERYGLAYSIHTSAGFFADTGAFVISAGLDNKRLEKALGLIGRELRRITRRPPSADELERARNYALGQLKLGLESTSNQMMWMGEHLLSYGKIIEPHELERRIKAVTVEDVAQVAVALLQPQRLNVAVIGPVNNRQKLEAALRAD
jgi:predicted Zn-dependent peptidase